MDDTSKELQTGYSCAACRIGKRKCGKKCLLAPYFPPDNREIFLTTTNLFRPSKIAKVIKDTPLEKRSDAVNSMVYEASVRKHDPVNGCVGLLSDLEKQVWELQSQLAAAKAELTGLQEAHPQSFIAGSSLKLEAPEFISDLTYSTPQELDLHMDDIIMAEDNSEQSRFWEELYWPYLQETK